MAKPQDPSHAATSFGPTHVIHPTREHTHTIILLHGRGSTAVDFAEELFDSFEESSTSATASHKTLSQTLPNWRWVFPSSRQLWSTTFQEHMPAWFEAVSLTNPSEDQHLQASGIRDAVSHVQQIVDDEVRRLNGKAHNVFLAGISQGGAIAMWTTLSRYFGFSHAGNDDSALGGLALASTWLPFAADIEQVLSRDSQVQQRQQRNDSTDGGWEGSSTFVGQMLAETRKHQQDSKALTLLLSMPVFFGHGLDDAYVDIALGRQAAATFEHVGFKVTWNEYSGAEQEGHWFKTPEELLDIVSFIQGEFKGTK